MELDGKDNALVAGLLGGGVDVKIRSSSRETALLGDGVTRTAETSLSSVESSTIVRDGCFGAVELVMAVVAVLGT